MKQNFKGWTAGASTPNSVPTKPVSQYGIKTLVEPHDATFDIVFVHGLTGGLERTWAHADGTFWPKDLLAADFDQARILTFGYDADVANFFGQASTNTLRDHGRTLCTDIAMARFRTSSNDRPLVFVAHSLGGLVCEQALLISSGAPEPYYQNILECTIGIIFMGTPHAGLDASKWTPVLANFAKLATHVNRDITDVLEPGFQVLASLQQEFHRLLARRAADKKSEVKIFCIFEELPVTAIGMIVERHSAVLNQYDCIGLHGNHIEIAKFGKDKAGYERVRDRLWVWINVEGAQRDALGSQGRLSVPIYQLRQLRSSNSKDTQERIAFLGDLTWQLYASCDEISDLKPLCLELGSLNLQFRKTKEHLSYGILDRAMQDMLLNAADGCYAILIDVEQQIKQYEKIDGSAVEEWNQVVWHDKKIQRRAASLRLYCQGLSAMNANFSSESKLMVVRKFLSFVHDVKAGNAEWSALSQSLDYVTAEDGESELVWKTLRHDLERTGVSTHIIDKNRSLITSKFRELRESGRLANFEQSVDALTMDCDSLEDYAGAVSSEEAVKMNNSAGLSGPARFFAAARSGRINDISAMINDGIEANMQDGSGNTALHIAASAGQAGVVDVLLLAGCDVSKPDAKGWTALRHALANGHYSVLKVVLKHDTESHVINQKLDYAEHTILHFAATSGDEDAVVLFLRAGANSNAKNRCGQTPLHLAAWRRDLIIMNHLLNASTDPGIEDFWGDTALDVAIGSPATSRDKTAGIRVLLEARRACEEIQVDREVELDDAVEFLSMDSIYDRGSAENIFTASENGGSIAHLLPKQFDMNDLADDLFEAIYHAPRKL